MRLLAFLPLALLIQEEPTVEILPGAAKGPHWSVLGRSGLPEGAELLVRARRVLRRWDAREERFLETLSDRGRHRDNVVVEKGRFHAQLRKGAEDIYEIRVIRKESLEFRGPVLLGSPERIFRRLEREKPRILQSRGQAARALRLVEKIMLGEADAGPEARKKFLADLQKEYAALREMEEELATTATVGLLVDAVRLLLNVQVWTAARRGAPAQQDGLEAKTPFLRKSVSIGSLRETLRSIEGVLGAELRLFTATALDLLLSYAELSPKRLATARRAAKTAGGLFAEPDDLLEEIAEAEEEDVPELRARLQERVRSLTGKGE